MQNLLSLPEAAKVLRVSQNHLRKLVAQKKIKCIVFSDRGDKRFAPEELERFIKEFTK